MATVVTTTLSSSSSSPSLSSSLLSTWLKKYYKRKHYKAKFDNDSDADDDDDGNDNDNDINYSNSNNNNNNNDNKNNSIHKNSKSNSNNNNNINNNNIDHTDNEPVKCIFLCEFHPIAGPKVAIQVPKDYISKDLFRIVNQYIIPKVQLQCSFLSVSLLGKKILGYPVRIDNKVYARNAFYFNICFVFDTSTRTIGYEPVVKKLTEYLMSLELSDKLLSQQNEPTQLDRLERLLNQVRNDINSKGMCMLQEGSATIPLCVVSHYRENIQVYAHQAPVFIDDFNKYVCAQWDLTTLRILPYVDGFNHINRISAMADVALGLVKDCIRHLVLLQVAAILPVFQYSNMYRPTPKLSLLAKCQDLQRRCIEKCSKGATKRAKVRDVFRMFASMAHGATYGELCVRFNPAALNINDKQMVLFGLIEGLIRIVNKYPITVNRNLFTGSDDDLLQKSCSNTSTAVTTTITAMPSTMSMPIASTTATTIITTTVSSTSSLSLSSSSTTTTTTMTTTPSILTSTNSTFNITRAFFDPTSGTFHHQTTKIGNPSKPLPRSGKAFNKQPIMQHQEEIPKIFYTGFKTFDEICCATNLSCQQLENLLDKDKHCIVLYK